MFATTALALTVALAACATTGRGSSSGSAGGGVTGGGGGGGGGAGAFTVRDVRGRRLSFGGKGDKLTLLVFWSSWCTTCFGKLRFLDRVYRAHKGRGFRLVGAAMDQPQTRARVKPAIKRYKLSFPSFIDAQGRVVQRLNPRRINSFAVLFKRGRVIERWSPIQSADLSAVKAKILAEL